MALVNDLLLDTLCYFIISRAQSYYLPAYNVLSIMYQTGCRREEAVTFSKWSKIDSSTIKLQPVKLNNPRYFTEAEVPDFWWYAVQNDIEPYPDFKISKVNYYIELLQLQVLYTDNKMLLSNQFRHNYAKKLSYSGLTNTEIKDKMGEKTLQPILSYITGPITSDSFIFTELIFTTTQADFQRASNNNNITSDNTPYFAINYADNTPPFCTKLIQNTPTNFPNHTFQNPFGSTIEKNVTFYISQAPSIYSLQLNQNFFTKNFPSNIQLLTNLKYLFLQSQSFHNISNLYINTLQNITYVFSNIMPNGLPTAAYSYSSNLFNATLNSFEHRTPYFDNNYPFDNLHLLQNSNNIIRLVITYYNFTTAPFDFSHLTTLEYISLRYLSLTSNILPSTIQTLVNVKELYFNSINLIDYTNISYLVSLQYFLSDNNQNLSTNFPLELHSLILLKSLRYVKTFTTQLKVDTFISNFYTFIDTYATKNTSIPNFRNIALTITGNSITPTGTYQMPTGFIQNLDNGTPASPYEKIWVLVNQYGHTFHL